LSYINRRIYSAVFFVACHEQGFQKFLILKAASNGGGGIRTRVPKRFKTGIYIHSYSFGSRLAERRITDFQLGQFVVSRFAWTNGLAKPSRILALR